jgi:FkbM family methyltransferase
MENYLGFKEIDNLKIYYLINDRCVGETISSGHIWESWMEKFIKHFYIKGTNMIDIGANIGAISFQQMRKHLSENNFIYDFEPFFGDIIEKTINVNNIKNVILHKMALSDSEKYLNLPNVDYSINQNFGGSNILNTTIDESNKCFNCYRLDYFNLNNISLIKIDVEGHELEVLKGMVETLKNNNFPTLLLEIWSFSKGWVYDRIISKHDIGIDMITRLVQTYRFLEELGYIMYHIEGDDFLFIHKNKKSMLADFIKLND